MFQLLEAVLRLALNDPCLHACVDVPVTDVDELTRHKSFCEREACCEAAGGRTDGQHFTPRFLVSTVGIAVQDVVKQAVPQTNALCVCP